MNLDVTVTVPVNSTGTKKSYLVRAPSRGFPSPGDWGELCLSLAEGGLSEMRLGKTKTIVVRVTTRCLLGNGETTLTKL